MRVLICGDREWSDWWKIVIWLTRHPEVTCVIEGECRGADKLARKAAIHLKRKVYSFPADWLRYGKAAGPIRNQQMIDEGKPDLVVAFHDRIAGSKGTRDMIRRARKAHIPIEVISHSCFD